MLKNMLKTVLKNEWKENRQSVLSFQQTFV